MTSTDKEVPGLLEVLAQVPDPRRKRGRRFSLVFVLAVAAVCTLAGARGFRELGDQAGDLPQEPEMAHVSFALMDLFLRAVIQLTVVC